MSWALLCVLGVVVAWQAVRLRRVEKDIFRQAVVFHDAANRAMQRHRRERWRWRETTDALRLIARETLPGYYPPDLLRGPPDDEESDGTDSGAAVV